MGTQIEFATLLCSEIAAETSAALVHSEGAFWAYSSTYWEEINQSTLRKRIHKLDGTSYDPRKAQGLTTEQLRQAVIHTRQKLATSERRICRVIGLSRRSLHYQRANRDEDELRLALIRLSKQHGR